MPVIEQVFQLRGHHIRHFHISTLVITGVGMDNLFAPEPLHRHTLSASAEKYWGLPDFTVWRCEMGQGTNRGLGHR